MHDCEGKLNRATGPDARWLLPGILAALATFWAATPASAADAKLNVISDRELEVAGGIGKQAWRIRYGRLAAAKINPQFVSADGNRAWFSHGGWLRLIDTEKGRVIGRWHFPGEMVRLTPQGGRLQVEVEERVSAGQTFHRVLMFDPGAPWVPYWPATWFLPAKLPMAEAQSLLPAAFSSTVAGVKVSAEEAKKFVPDLEGIVRRDPTSPWFQVMLGRALRDTGDPRASTVFRQAAQVSTSDFTELLPVSAYLDKLGETEVAGEAFERGYGDFWARGNDPRLLTSLISRLMVYGPRGESWGKPDSKQGRELLERVYKLMPYGEAAELAWRAHADYLQKKGQTGEADLWRARAEEATRNGTLSFWAPAIGRSVDQCILIILAAFIATALYSMVLYARYRPQHRLDRAAQKRSAGFWRFAAILNSQYWSRRERVALLSIVFAGWFTFGLAQLYLQAVLSMATMPVGVGGGSYAGPVNIAALESHLPPSPEHELMLALAYQQDGQKDKAEGLYRGLPQFPESWNNLGAILKDAGKDDEARAAFEKALQLDPTLAEAELNLGRSPKNFWTEQHQKYLPGRPMLAPPRGERLQRALLGGSPARLYWRSLAGPFSGESAMSFFKAVGKLGG